MSAGHRTRSSSVDHRAAGAGGGVRREAGTPVFFYAGGGECSSVEREPWFGETAEGAAQVHAQVPARDGRRRHLGQHRRAGLR
jgi:hypothetical protein